MTKFTRRSLLLGAGAAASFAQQQPSVDERTRKLHFSSLVFDAHVHMGNRHFYNGGTMGDRLSDGQVDLPRLKEGGVNALFFSVWVTEPYYPARYETKQLLRLIDFAKREIDRNRAHIELALTAADIERIRKSGKIAAILDVEGGFDLDGDLGVLRQLHALGLRSFQLSAHNWANNFADSCCALPKWKGLNERGRDVIREANRLGMVINISHSSDATIDQALDVSTKPLVATHHGLRRFNQIPRTMSDELLKKLASKGGVIGFHIGNEFHNRKMFDWRTARAGKPFWDTTAIGKKESELSIEEIDKLNKGIGGIAGEPAPDEIRFPVDDWVNVVDTAIQIAGEDHVCLGSDWDGGPTLPRGMRDVRDVPMITAAMLRRGYSETRIRKFLGLNLLRVVRANIG